MSRLEMEAETVLPQRVYFGNIAIDDVADTAW
jgi:hypothetical protein